MKNNMYKRPWRKRKNKNINGIIAEFKSVPFVQLKGDEKLLFFADDDRWNVEGITKWLNMFSETFPSITFAVLPLTMFKNVQRITGKEYSMLNNILKRCMENKEK